MPKQHSLNLYGKGIYKTKDGHLRYHSPRNLRGKYVHRELVDRLISETPWSVRLLIPWPFEVHHMDYNKEHNEPHNLLLLSIEFHSVLTADMPRDHGKFTSKFHPKWQPPPQWVLFRDDDKEIESIPF